MNIIALILNLLHKYTPVEEMEFTKIQNEARTWYGEINTDEQEAPLDMKGKAKKLAEQWYMKVFFAFMFVIAGRWLYDYMNGITREEMTDEEKKDNFF